MSKNRPVNYPPDRILRSFISPEPREVTTGTQQSTTPQPQEQQIDQPTDTQLQPPPAIAQVRSKMATCITLKQFDGTESPIIWLSYLDNQIATSHNRPLISPTVNLNHKQKLQRLQSYRQSRDTSQIHPPMDMWTNCSGTSLSKERNISE